MGGGGVPFKEQKAKENEEKAEERAKKAEESARKEMLKKLKKSCESEESSDHLLNSKC